MMESKIQSNLPELMTKKNIAVRALAELSGVSIETIMRARDSRIIGCKLGTLERIAEVLNCEISELFYIPLEREND